MKFGVLAGQTVVSSASTVKLPTPIPPLVAGERVHASAIMLGLGVRAPLLATRTRRTFPSFPSIPILELERS